MFDNKFKLQGSLCDFKDDNDIHSLLSEYVLLRFQDLDSLPLSLYRIFDFRIRPHTLTELSVYGCHEIKEVCTVQ